MRNTKLVSTREILIALISSILSCIICIGIFINEDMIAYYKTIDHIKLLAWGLSIGGVLFIMIRYLIEKYIDKK